MIENQNDQATQNVETSTTTVATDQGETPTTTTENTNSAQNEEKSVSKEQNTQAIEPNVVEDKKDANSVSTQSDNSNSVSQEQSSKKEEGVKEANLKEESNQNPELEGDKKEETEEQPKTLTQDEFDKALKKRLAKKDKQICERFGVENLDQVDDLIAKGQAYSILSIDYEDLKKKNKDLEDQIKGYKENETFSKLNIAPDRYDDVRTYFKGKELDLTEDSLIKNLETHPEWKIKTEEPVKTEPITTQKSQPTIRVLGNDSGSQPAENTKARIMGYFGEKVQ